MAGRRGVVVVAETEEARFRAGARRFFVGAVFAFVEVFLVFFAEEDEVRFAVGFFVRRGGIAL